MLAPREESGGAKPEGASGTDKGRVPVYLSMQVGLVGVRVLLGCLTIESISSIGALSCGVARQGSCPCSPL